MPTEITSVEVVGGTRLRLGFAAGDTGTVDIASLTPLDGVFEPLRDPAFFAKVRVDPDLGTICWPNGADLCPDVLRHAALGTPLPGQAGSSRLAG